MLGLITNIQSSNVDKREYKAARGRQLGRGKTVPQSLLFTQYQFGSLKKFVGNFCPNAFITNSIYSGTARVMQMRVSGWDSQTVCRTGWAGRTRPLALFVSGFQH